MTWLTANAGTIVVLAILVVLVGLVIRKPVPSTPPEKAAATRTTGWRTWNRR